MEGAAALGASGGPISPQRRRLRPVQLLPLRLRDRRQARHARQLPAARRRRRGADPGRGRGRSGSWSRTGARSGSRLGRRRRRQRSRPFTVRARRAVIAAGGALGTPELLLRSGLGGRQVGRNLHIHPACWVGARYEEEVRGWEGVMQSYYVDQWEHDRDPARGDLHAARLRRRLAARHRRRAPAGDARLRPRRLDRRPPLRPVLGPGRARQRRLAAGQLQADGRRRRPRSPSASPAPPKSTSPPAPPRSTPTSPASASCRPGDLAEFEATRFKPSELRLEAFHPMGTARIAADPSARESAPSTAPSTAPATSTSPTPPSSRPRSASTR